MSRQELADAVNAYLAGKDDQRYQREATLDANHIGKLERGEHRWPNEFRREAFQHVLHVSTDSEIGFYIIRGVHSESTVVEESSSDLGSAAPVPSDAADGNESSSDVDRRPGMSPLNEGELPVPAPGNGYINATSEDIAGFSEGARFNNLAMIDILALSWMLGKLDQRMGRREILRLAATLATASAVGVADPIERIAHALTRPSGLTSDMVEYLEARSLGFHQLEFVLPAGQIFRGLLAHLNDITTLLQVCPQDKDPLRKRLARTAGEAAVLGAWVAWDLGDAQRAASLYHTAELAAEVSGDPAILACSAIYQSFGLAGTGAHLTARQRLADARQALPPRGDLATRAWLLGREAEELAAMGDPAAKDMIEKASDLLMQARPMQERSWTRCLESPRLTNMRLTIATRLADETGVYEYISDLTALTGDLAQKKTGRGLASIGLALVTIGDVQEGIQAGQRSLEAVKTTRARYALDRLTQLGAALTGTSALERDLRESIRATRQELLSPRPSTPDRHQAPH